MLERFKAQGLLKARGRQRTDSTAVVAAIRTLNRLECLGETLRHALNSLAVGQNAYVALNGPLYLNGLFGTSTTIAGTLDLMGFNGYLAGLGALMDGIYTDMNGNLVNIVDAPVAAVPEPSTWAMMAIGFIGLGFSFRQRRRKVGFA